MLLFYIQANMGFLLFRQVFATRHTVSRLTLIDAHRSSNDSVQVKVDKEQHGVSVAQCAGRNSPQCGFIHLAETRDGTFNQKSSFMIVRETAVQILQEHKWPLSLILALGLVAILGGCIHDIHRAPARNLHLPQDTNESVRNSPLPEDAEPAFYYITYWSHRSQDPIGCWNPTEVGGEDGVQLAIVKDDTVERVPTTNMCSHMNSAMRSCKEWLNVREPFTVVNYVFDKIPTIEEARQREAEFGKRRVFVGRPGWGGNCIASRAIFNEFHSSESP